MKTIQSMLVSAALAITMAAPALAGVNDPEIIIYRIPGIFDSGAADDNGIATSFHCTNFSGVVENIRFVTRGPDSTLRSNAVFPIAHLSTLTVSTHATVLYSEGTGVLTTGPVAQGTTAIAATSINIVCTAVTLNASSQSATGFALRPIRFSPAPGSQE